MPLCQAADILHMLEKNNGPRSYRELIRNRTPSLQVSGVMSIICEFLSRGLRWPVIGRLLSQSFILVCCALNRLRQKMDYPRLYELLVESLLSATFRKKHNYRWWYLMRFAVSIAQERQINWLIRDRVLEDNLTLLGSLGPRPLKGYDVAYSFVGYSLWLFERGDVSGAISLVKIAAQADESWGYPEYLHGWYGLFTHDVNSVEHFVRAVQIDWSFLQRMKHDKTCRERPDIVHEVQKRTLVSTK